MATYIRTNSIIKRIKAKKSNIVTFSPANFKWNCKRVRIFVGVSNRLKVMKKHNCFIPITPFVVPVK